MSYCEICSCLYDGGVFGLSAIELPWTIFKKERSTFFANNLVKACRDCRAAIYFLEFDYFPGSKAESEGALKYFRAALEVEHGSEERLNIARNVVAHLKKMSSEYLSKRIDALKFQGYLEEQLRCWELRNYIAFRLDEALCKAAEEHFSYAIREVEFVTTDKQQSRIARERASRFNSRNHVMVQKLAIGNSKLFEYCIYYDLLTKFRDLAVS